MTEGRLSPHAAHLSPRVSYAAGGAALGALPLVRSIDALAQVTNPVFRHGVASGDPLSGSGDPLDARHDRARRRGRRQTVWTMAQRSPGSRAWSTRGQTADRRGPGLHRRRSVACTGLAPGTDVLLPLPCEQPRSQPVGRTQDAAARATSAASPAWAWCPARTYPQGYFNAYACARGARRRRRRASTSATTSTSTPTGSSGDGTALGRIPAPDKEIVALRGLSASVTRSYKADPGFAGHPSPAPVHRRLGRSRVREQRVVGRR